MSAKFLFFDIGNTSTKVGLADEKGVFATYGLPGGSVETGDSLGLTLLSLVRHAGVDPVEITACAASSVNPAVDDILSAAARRYFNCQVLFACRELAVPLANNFPRPQEVGADMLVGAYEARKLFPGRPSLIVADFGTAATFACVEGDAFNGGLIFPGPQTAMRALSSLTAKLPQVRLEDPGPEPEPCRDTTTSIQHGLLFGYGAMAAGLCNLLKKKLKSPAFTVATGGFAPLVDKLGNIFDAVVPALVLDGLFRLYMDRSQAKK